MSQPRGFDVPCLKCGEVGEISLRLDDLKTLYCRECGDEFTVEDVQKALDAWRPVLNWLKNAQVFIANPSMKIGNHAAPANGREPLDDRREPAPDPGALDSIDETA